ncbi:biotin-dependent carboxyltransferase family protein [Thalassococcus sp. CAU 1522]|uniref:Biotin-dependent carboxyltransferase family protein n=1 Tax=Thalassococcus arenae TaxID=2851652 RepID=A0ABS6NCA1_9RHOB|nr:biotin-dependent carboxyltransferase family protein [Thalassococcus arenae]MBV2361194.1 biotin-dependent carboxyltransferase family protein [Thalassococcus arenae]
MSALRVLRAGPGVTVQDMGRPGYLGFGLSRGGAADRLALSEGAALLGQDTDLAALEMAGFGGVFEAMQDLRIALSGAPMSASIDGTRIAWNASHALPQGARLEIGGVTAGCYGYLHVGGGFDTPIRLGSRAAHLAAGLGTPVAAGQILSVGVDPKPDRVGLCLDPDPRFEGGRVRLLAGPQTRLFSSDELARFLSDPFRRDTRGNRMGVRLIPSDAPYASQAGLSVLSEVVVPGDVQITGDGTPFVLMTECQTTGGYPRIGTVLAADLPRVAQAPAGATLRFEFAETETASRIEAAEARRIATLRNRLRRLIRDPAEIRDLLSYQLISGAIAGNEPG